MQQTYQERTEKQNKTRTKKQIEQAKILPAKTKTAILLNIF